MFWQFLKVIFRVQCVLNNRQNVINLHRRIVLLFTIKIFYPVYCPSKNWSFAIFTKIRFFPRITHNYQWKFRLHFFYGHTLRDPEFSSGGDLLKTFFLYIFKVPRFFFILQFMRIVHKIWDFVYPWFCVLREGYNGPCISAGPPRFRSILSDKSVRRTSGSSYGPPARGAPESEGWGTTRTDEIGQWPIQPVVCMVTDNLRQGLHR